LSKASPFLLAYSSGSVAFQQQALTTKAQAGAYLFVVTLLYICESQAGLAPGQFSNWANQITVGDKLLRARRAVPRANKYTSLHARQLLMFTSGAI
jgi:hypothetical protein